jgi:hypothetical protein
MSPPTHLLLGQIPAHRPYAASNICQALPAGGGDEGEAERGVRVRARAGARCGGRD